MDTVFGTVLALAVGLPLLLVYWIMQAGWAVMVWLFDHWEDMIALAGFAILFSRFNVIGNLLSALGIKLDAISTLSHRLNVIESEVSRIDQRTAKLPMIDARLLILINMLEAIQSEVRKIALAPRPRS